MTARTWKPLSMSDAHPILADEEGKQVTLPAIEAWPRLQALHRRALKEAANGDPGLRARPAQQSYARSLGAALGQFASSHPALRSSMFESVLDHVDKAGTMDGLESLFASGMTHAARHSADRLHPRGARTFEKVGAPRVAGGDLAHLTHVDADRHMVARIPGDNLSQRLKEIQKLGKPTVGIGGSSYVVSAGDISPAAGVPQGPSDLVGLGGDDDGLHFGRIGGSDGAPDLGGALTQLRSDRDRSFGKGGGGGQGTRGSSSGFDPNSAFSYGSGIGIGAGVGSRMHSLGDVDFPSVDSDTYGSTRVNSVVGSAPTPDVGPLSGVVGGPAGGRVVGSKAGEGDQEPDAGKPQSSPTPTAPTAALTAPPLPSVAPTVTPAPSSTTTPTTTTPSGPTLLDQIAHFLSGGGGPLEVTVKAVEAGKVSGGSATLKYYQVERDIYAGKYAGKPVPPGHRPADDGTGGGGGGGGGPKSATYMPSDQGAGSPSGPRSFNSLAENSPAADFAETTPNPDTGGGRGVGPRARRANFAGDLEMPNPDGTSPVTPHA